MVHTVRDHLYSNEFNPHYIYIWKVSSWLLLCFGKFNLLTDGKGVTHLRSFCMGRSINYVRQLLEILDLPTTLFNPKMSNFLGHFEPPTYPKIGRH